MDSGDSLSDLEEEKKIRYISLLSQLEKSIQTDFSLEHCVKICEDVNALGRQVGKIDITALEKAPFKTTNVVILACKHGMIEFLNYILFEDEDILRSVTKPLGRNEIRATDQDFEGKTAFYYALKHPKTDLLEALINRWKGSSTHTLDQPLSVALRELKLRNIPLSIEIQVLVESYLVELRFYEPKPNQQQKKKRVFNPDPVLQRIHWVLENAEVVLGPSPSHEAFTFCLKQIATSVHVLKRQMRPTYDSVPWEEIEFHLSCFLACHGAPQELSLLHGSILSEAKIRGTIKNLSSCLQHIKDNASTVLTGQYNFPQVQYRCDKENRLKYRGMTRSEMRHNILETSPFTTEFYDDFEALRDFATFETVSKYLRLSTAVDPKDWRGKMVLTKCLQVVGEHLKDTVESPKLSPGSTELLLASLPQHTAEVLQKLRHALSHDHALEVRVDLEKNTKAFFLKIQMDLQKLADAVEGIKYRKKTIHTQKLLKTLTRCDTVQEMRNVLGVNELTVTEDLFKEPDRNMLVEGLETLIQSLQSHLKKKTKFEESLFSNINSLLKTEKEKLNEVKQVFVKGKSWLNLIGTMLNGDPQEIRNWASEALRQVSHERSMTNFSNMRHLCLDLLSSIAPRRNSESYVVPRIMFVLSDFLDFDLKSVRWIHELKSRLDTEAGHKKKKAKNLYGDLLLKKTRLLEEVLKENRLEKRNVHKTLTDYKSDEKLQSLVEMLLLDIMSIFQANSRLSENPCFLDSDHPLVLGQNLRKHLAHENALVRVLTDVHMDILLAANFVVSTTNTADQMDKVLKNNPLLLKESCNRYLQEVVVNQTRLFKALEAGHLPEARDCLDSGADINGRDCKFRTALHYASTVECARFAAESGVKPFVDMYGLSALHSAALYGRIEVVRFLTDELEMTVDDRDNFHNTPLHLAAMKGHLGVVEFLLSRGASTGAEDGGGDTPLHAALDHGHLETAKLLLNQEVHADSGETLGGFTPLHIAGEAGMVDMVTYLLDMGAEVNLKNNEGFTALHRAALTGQVEVVNYLLSRGAVASITSISGFTAAHLAAKNGHWSVLSSLGEKDVRLDSIDRTDKRSPLHHAAVNGHLAAVRVLLKKGVDLERRTVLGQTPLHLACFSGSRDVVELLLKSGAEVDAVDDKGSTPLLIAVHEGDFPVLESLLNHGSDPNPVCKQISYTALHFACTFGHRDIAQLLIKHGADVEAENDNGHTPLELSIYFHHSEIALMLINEGKGINRKNERLHKTLLLAAVKGRDDILKELVSRGARADPKAVCLACSSGNLDSVKFLVDCGLDVNSKVEGSTLLHDSVDSNQFEIVEYLVNSGADPNITNKNGFTPLLEAVNLNLKDIAEKLVKAGAEVNRDLLMIAVNHGGELMKILMKDLPSDLEGEKALFFQSCVAGIKSSAEFLLSRGVPVNCVDEESGSPLLNFVVNRPQVHHDILVYLLSKGGDIEAGSANGETPLYLASVIGNERSVEILLSAGAKVYPSVMKDVVVRGHLEVLKLFEKEGHIDSEELRLSLLREAVKWGHLGIVRHLAKSGIEPGVVYQSALNGCVELVTFFLDSGLAKVDERTESGETILHFAAYGQCPNLVGRLVVRGADVDAADALGSTPSHVAASKGDIRFTKSLLQRGAVHDPLNSRDMTPLEVAQSYEFVDLVAYLTHTAELFSAVKKKDLKKTKNLLAKGAVVNSKSREGTTPLHLAAWKGSRTVAELLIQNGGNPNAKGKGDSTPLHYASNHGHLGVVEVLIRGGARFNCTLPSGKTPLDLAKTSQKSQVAELLGFIHITFKAIQRGDCGIVQEIKSKPSNWIKAVLQARNSENRTLMVSAIRSDFPRVNSLKTLLQDDRKDIIAKAMMKQGALPSKIRIIQSHIDARSEIFGPDCPSVLDTMEDMAQEKHKVGQKEEALSDMRHILQKRQEIVGMGVEILITKKNLACMLFLQEKYEESMKIYQELHPKQVQVYGPNDSEAIRSLLYISMITLAMKKFEESILQCEELLQRVKDPLDETYLQALSVKASALQSKKNYSEALRIFRDIAETRKRVLGPSHSKTIGTLHDIKSVLTEQGRHLESLEVCLEILGTQSSSSDYAPIDVLKTMTSVGRTFMSRGQHLEAYRSFNSVLKLSSEMGVEPQDAVTKTMELLEMRYEFVFVNGGLRGLLEEPPKGCFQPGSYQELREMSSVELRRRDSSTGGTALHWCVRSGDEGSLRLLLRRGLDALLKDDAGENALQLAMKLGQNNMVQILCQHLRLSRPWELK